ncbi:MAG TPA: CPBP family intramembrane glutamic endopeptidase [Puia sp.]|nr:CPBP family intramembrane glutamic endopeptidase [Puia sp.]
MIGIFVEVILSWILLKFIERKDLSVLGLLPTRQRLRELMIGLLLSVPFPIAFLAGVSLLVHNPYHLHPHYSLKDFLNAAGYVFKAVLYEDLIFRGALLYILIKRLGPQKAVLISAVLFGIYHWFSWGALGQPVQMAIIFLTTGLAGYVFALAFEKTGSIYMPFALHFGIDFVNMVIFSQDKAIGLQLLVKTFATDPASPGSVISILVILVHFTWFPVLALAYLRHRKLKNPLP